MLNRSGAWTHSMGNIEKIRSLAIVEEAALHVVMEGPDSVDKLWWAANLPQDLPKSLSVYGVKALLRSMETI